MKKFSFSLQKLLDYKEQLFETERAVLAEMHAQLSLFLSELDAMQAEHDQRAAAFREKALRGMGALDMEIHKNYMTALDFTIRQKQHQIELQRQAIDRQTDKLREAKIELSTIEKLREKKLEEYRYAEDKAQEQFIEEFVSNTKAAALFGA